MANEESEKKEKKSSPKITSAAKRLRNSQRANARNRARGAELKTVEKKFRAAVEAKDADGAARLLREVASKLDKAAKGSSIHSNKAANKKSQLDKLMNSLNA